MPRSEYTVLQKMLEKLEQQVNSRQRIEEEYVVCEECRKKETEQTLLPPAHCGGRIEEKF